jgi:hypothetical protein
MTLAVGFLELIYSAIVSIHVYVARPPAEQPLTTKVSVSSGGSSEKTKSK